MTLGRGWDLCILWSSAISHHINFNMNVLDIMVSNIFTTENTTVQGSFDKRLERKLAWASKIIDCNVASVLLLFFFERGGGGGGVCTIPFFQPQFCGTANLHLLFSLWVSRLVHAQCLPVYVESYKICTLGPAENKNKIKKNVIVYGRGETI